MKRNSGAVAAGMLATSNNRSQLFLFVVILSAAVHLFSLDVYSTLRSMLRTISAQKTQQTFCWW